MTDTPPNKPQRGPATFSPDDPALKTADVEFDLPPHAEPESPEDAAHNPEDRIPITTQLERGVRWGSLFFAAMFALTGLSLSLWFTRLISVGLARQDWIGWVTLGLFAAMALAAIAIALREIFGLIRLNKLEGLREDADAALRKDDLKEARSVVRRLKRNLKGRTDLSWKLSQFKEHEANVLDGAGLLALADRELLAPIDIEVREVIRISAKRVAIGTALSPSTLIDVLVVFANALSMLRKIATLYGGRPGFLAGLKLGRQVVSHIIMTGGIALTDDLLGQFLGQDLIRRLSRKAGEGMFNGALTARLGLATLEICRPIDFIESPQPRFRDFAKDLASSLLKGKPANEK